MGKEEYQDIIVVNGLTKKYGNHTAVNNLSFSIKKGRVYGFLGPNGAGKSTTMNIMTGCLAATNGTVLIGDYDIFEQPENAKKLIGYLPEQPPLYMDRTPREYLKFVAEAKGVSRKNREEELDRVMKITGIKTMSDRLIRNLSKGYKQRVGIAQALLGDPEVIILDEPTVGLDPKQIIEIRDLIKNLGKDHTVILSSHILSEVQTVCDTILIISKGNMVACDTPDNLEKMYEGTINLRLKIKGNKADVKNMIKSIKGISHLTLDEEDGNTLVTIESDEKDKDAFCTNIFWACANKKLPILQMNMEKASLEEVFLELTAVSTQSENAKGESNEEKSKDGKEDEE